ncbi:glycosyl transferase [Longimonas halophila]|uniref:Glycosyl transferase n=1 Tax=Longimonas halophila TaxID=1469170 RepID=A0A2H3NMH2_9BACT|nr:glycosyltransferase [Longimonas halophila]PEN07870.1 glycosyl transferase [Longimonas halophila]
MAAPSVSPNRLLMHVGPAYPYRGGIAHFTELTARALRNAGHPPRLCTFTRQYPAWLFPGRTQTVEPGTPPPAGLPKPDRRIDTLNPLTWHRTARWMQQEAAGAVMQYWMPFMALPFAYMAWQMRRAGRPVVGIIHNALPHERHWGDAQLSRLFLHQLSGAVALSESVAADVRALTPALPTEQVDHPAYTRFGTRPDQTDARARLDLPTEGLLVLFFGFVRRYKGLDVLLDAWPAVQEHRPNPFLCIAGEAYDDPAPYRAQMEALPHPDRVRWDDRYIPEDQVADYFAAADLVVQPYRHATQSGVVQIAAHMNRPVIVTDVGGLPETIDSGRTGFVVPPEDPDALAEAIIHACQPEQQRILTGPQATGGSAEALAQAVDRMLKH